MIIEKPILYKSEMIKAIWEDRKNQTRRLNGLQKINKNINRIETIKQWQPALELPYGFYSLDCDNGWEYLECPYTVGMHLWCRETWMYETEQGIKTGDYIYQATDRPIPDNCKKLKWKPSIFMPRKASRITLEITDIRAERIQEITDEDAIKEGIDNICESIWGYRDYSKPKPINMGKHTSGFCLQSISSFRTLWNLINAKPKPKFKNKIITHYESYPWSDDTRDKRTIINGKPHYCYLNPYVWANSFRVIKKG